MTLRGIPLADGAILGHTFFGERWTIATGLVVFHPGGAPSDGPVHCLCFGWVNAMILAILQLNQESQVYFACMALSSF
jgi:hypothetical protein